MHCMYLLCQVMLNREYVPFVPLNCKEPVGPLDPPLFPRETVPPNFWAERAEECFKSAREIVDLARTCRQWHSMVETPFMGFSLYITGFVAVYCDAFPWMDPHGHMCTPRNAPDRKGAEAGQHAQEIVKQMSSRLPMANGWCQALERMQKHYKQKTADHHAKYMHSASQPSSVTSTKPYRTQGRFGGGLDEYKQMEHILEFGRLEDGELPQLELVTSRDSASQVGEAVTPALTATSSDRQYQPLDGIAPEGADKVSSSVPPDQRYMSQMLPTAAIHQPSTSSIDQQAGAFRMPTMPRDSAVESSPASTAVCTPSSAAAQPSPVHMYNQAAFLAWPTYNQTGHSLPSSGFSAPVQQDLMIPRTAPAYSTFPGALGVTLPSGQYVPTGMDMPAATEIQPWSPESLNDNSHHVADLGVVGDDFVAFVEGGSVADYAQRAVVAASRGQCGDSWLQQLWDPRYSS